MRFDIRLPIGLLFLAMGLLLVAVGLTDDPARLRMASLGMNIDLAWGAVLAVFGAAMLGLTWLGRGPNA